MTKNAAAKRAARARVEQTGEKYTDARRATGHAKVRRVEADRDRGALTLVISGGGAGNLGLVLDDLAELVRLGHPLLVTDHDSGRGLANMPSRFDFAVARGMATNGQVADALRGDDELAQELWAAGAEGIRWVGPRGTSSEWASALTPGRQGQAPVLWVQDVEEDAPIAEQPGPEDMRTPDHVPLQLAALRELALQTGAIVVAGHCIPGSEEGAWRTAADEADRTYVIVTDWNGELKDGRLPETLREIPRGGRETQTALTKDTDAFFGWRDALR